MHVAWRGRVQDDRRPRCRALCGQEASFARALNATFECHHLFHINPLNTTQCALLLGWPTIVTALMGANRFQVFVDNPPYN